MAERLMMAAMALVLAAGPAAAQEAAPKADAPPAPAAAKPEPAAPAPGTATTYGETDVLKAATNAFGKGAEGLAEAIRKTFRERGQPNAYIVGSEGGGAFIVGLRYGAGTLFHKVEGEQKVHWTGPSVGVDVGGSAAKVFALVYNLNDTADLFHRYPAAESKAYFVGGVSVQYLERGGVTVVPVKLGAGLRLGVNGGYMKFTRKGRIVPF